VIGVGVNYRLSGRALDAIDQPVTDVIQCSEAAPSRSVLLGRLAASLARAFAEFDARGFVAARSEWLALHAYQGRAVRVMPANQPAFDGEVVDVAPDGALVVATAKGPVHLASAEISLRAKS